MAKGPNGEVRPGDTVGCAVKVGKIAIGEIIDQSDSCPPKRRDGALPLTDSGNSDKRAK